jgi:hypothetical protein
MAFPKKVGRLYGEAPRSTCFYLLVDFTYCLMLRSQTQILNHRGHGEHGVSRRKTRLELSCLVGFKYFKTPVLKVRIAVSGTGLKSPLETRKLRTSGAGDRLGARQRANPARRRLDCPQCRGLRVIEVVAWLRFLATQKSYSSRDART